MTNELPPLPDGSAFALVDKHGVKRLLHLNLQASQSAESRWPDAYRDCTHEPLFTAEQMQEYARAAIAQAHRPLTPEVPRGANINQRLTFKAGWEAAEAAHGIKGGEQ